MEMTISIETDPSNHLPVDTQKPTSRHGPKLDECIGDLARRGTANPGLLTTCAFLGTSGADLGIPHGQPLRDPQISALSSKVARESLEDSRSFRPPANYREAV